MKRKFSRVFSIAMAVALILMSTAAALATAAPTEEPVENVGEPCISLRTTYADGKPIPAPSGRHDGDVSIFIPLHCEDGPLYDVKIAPNVSTDIESFPFTVSQLDYTKKYGSVIKAGDDFDFTYNFTIGHYATKGVKDVSFVVSYRYGDPAAQLTTETVHIYLTITRGYSAGGGGSATEPTAVPYTEPKLIVESFSADVDKIYAGEPFTLNLTIRNTSSEQGVCNLQFNIAEANGVILPANKSSGSIYVAEIAAGGTKDLSVSFQSAPDAEAKPYTLSITMSYNGEKSKASYEAASSVTISLQQRTRVKCDSVNAYDEAWLGSSCELSLQFVNLGKSTVYNTMINVDCEGLTMNESYFGGNVTSGGSVYADFSVTPEMAGYLSGDVVISYEDVYGEQMELRVPLELNVNETVIPDEPTDPSEPSTPDTPTDNTSFLAKYWWALALGGVAVGGAVAGIVVKKKRHARSLEDV